MDEAGATASLRLSPHEDARQQESAQLACAVCRHRKVKCDRLLPNCTGCSNNPQRCIYARGRKKAARRSAPYQNVVERLAKMESVVKEFSRSKISPLPSNEYNTSPEPHIIPISPPRELLFEEDRIINGSMTPLLINGQSFVSGSESQLNHNAAIPIDKARETKYTGSLCIFSPRGIRWINELIGDDCFGREVSALTLTTTPQNCGNVCLSSIHPLPSRTITIDCTHDYLTVLNSHMCLFDGQEIMRGVERYYSTGISPSRGWFTAVNIILAHARWKRSGMENSVDHEKHLGNAMSMIPSILMSKPNILNAGAMLSMSLYFTFLCERQTAVMILGATIQLMILGGYDTAGRRPGQSEKEKLHERRLFWWAFVLDHDLALQIGKPPMIGPDFIIDLPDEFPEDGVGTMTFDSGTSLNYLRERVTLAQIKSKIYSLLFARGTTKRHCHEEAKIISGIDSELCAWRARIPEITMSDRPERDNKDPRLMSLTILHYTYYQLITVVHSFIFESSDSSESDGTFETICSSVALCVGAARATLSLLDFHRDDHPFSIHLFNNVSWSLDVIFMNILQNKGTISAQEDLILLGRVVSLSKKCDPNYIHGISFRIANIFYKAAWRALQNHVFQDNPPPNNVPAPIGVRLSKAWNRHIQSSTEPNDTYVSKPLYSNHIPLCNETPSTQATFPLEQSVLAECSLPKAGSELRKISLDDSSIFATNNMISTGQEQGGSDTEWRISLGLEPRYWQGLWTIEASSKEEDWLG